MVGHANGTLVMVDGGSPTTLSGTDVFVVRVDGNRDVAQLLVLNYAGDQTAVGAIWLAPRLVIGGGCGVDAGSAPFCLDGGAYVFGMEVPP